MAYSSNPRIVKGKVEVIFADTDISSISGVNVSGNADISHPNEVYGSNLNPTVKACTMDGNSTMDGTFQMMDDTCTLGLADGQPYHPRRPLQGHRPAHTRPPHHP